jgi:putative ABC transport system permease protein
MFRDLRSGLRMLRKQPGFTAVAVIALALGIGVNTTIFSYINTIQLRALTFAEPDRVAFIWSENRARGKNENPVSAPDFIEWREQAQSFEAMCAIAPATRTLTGTGEPERVSSSMVSPNFFQLLGVRPAFGHAFQANEGSAGASRVAVLSHSFWQRRFGGNSAVLQQPITLDGESYTVVGIAPIDFRGISGPDLWEPLSLDINRPDRNHRFLTVFGRLKPGVTIEQAGAEMEMIAARIASRYPETSTGWGARPVPAPDVFVSSEGRLAMALMMGVVFGVLLIACANVANLQFARATARQKEIAVRLALGAGRLRLIRQLLTENLLLALLGGAGGLLLASWGMSLMHARYAGANPTSNDVTIDGRVLGFTMLLALLSALIFGLAPALRASRTDPHEALKEGGRSGASGRHAAQTRSALVVAEISLALVLLVVAGLMIRTMIAFELIEPGFDPDNLLTMRVSLPVRDYDTEQKARDLFQRAIPRIAAQPGVKSVAAIDRLPLAGSRRNPSRSITIEGRPPSGANDAPWAVELTVSPGYFETIGIPLLRGRQLTSQDSADATRVAMISDTMARKYWSGDDPLGKRIRLESRETNDRWITIVGIVGDVRNDDVDAPPLPQLYLPHAQNPLREMSLIVRTTGDPLSNAAAARASVWAIDGNLPVYQVSTMKQLFFEDLAGVRIVVELLGAFAALALILAAVGIYGVMSYSVAQRTNEIGIRLALGAQKRDVMSLIVRQGMKLVIAGVTIGIFGALALTRVMKSMLYGVSATDPVTITGMASILALVALLACWIPAWQATKVDPIVTLRAE